MGGSDTTISHTIKHQRHHEKHFSTEKQNNTLPPNLTNFYVDPALYVDSKIETNKFQATENS